MLDIQIYNEKWWSLDFKEINIGLNYSVLNITNPSRYKSEFTKSLELPLTKNNAAAFGHTNRLDSLQTTSFSIARSVKARVFNDNDLVFEGKFAVTSVSISDSKITGNLYGNLNEWYTTLAELTFADGYPEVLPDNYQINRDNVIASFARRPSLKNETLALPGQTGYNVHDFIGWAPTINGETNDFNSSSMINSSGQIVKVWEAFGLTGDDSSSASSIIDKPGERMMLQYRSYNMKPYFYVDKICQLVQNYCNNNDNVPSLELDYRFFNNANSYYRNAVYLLPNLISETEETAVSTRQINIDGRLSSAISLADGSTISNNANWTDIFTRNVEFYKSASSQDPDNILQDGHLVGNGAKINFTCNIAVGQITWSAVNSWQNWNSIPGWPDAQVSLQGNLRLVARLIDANNTTINNTEQVIHTITPNSAWQGRPVTQTSTGTGNQIKYTWTSPSFNADYTQEVTLGASSTARLQVTLQYQPKSYYNVLNSTSSYALWQQATVYKYSGGTIVNYSNDIFRSQTNSTMKIESSLFKSGDGNVTYQDSNRSGRHLSIKDIWKSENEFTPFKVFLNYCKMMNIGLYYDENRNKLTAKPRELMFLDAWEEQSTENIEDWTNKIQWNSGTEFNPVSWESKYLLLDYEETEADRISDFQKRYGYAYGGKKIKTMYEYNDEEENIFEDDKINSSAEMSEYLYSCWDVYRTVIEDSFYPTAKLMTESFIINRNGTSTADIQNCFFFRTNTNGTWSTQLNEVPVNGTQTGTTNGVWITDDSSEELRNNTFCYQRPWVTTSGSYANATKTTVRPIFTHYYDFKCLLFSAPVEDFFNPSVVTRNANDIYNTRWSSIINELYNEQNKLLTCKVWLTPADYKRIKAVKYVRVDNVLYLVNKVIDYNPAKTGPTEVELLQIKDIANYTSYSI